MSGRVRFTDEPGGTTVWATDRDGWHPIGWADEAAIAAAFTRPGVTGLAMDWPAYLSAYGAALDLGASVTIAADLGDRAGRGLLDPGWYGRQVSTGDEVPDECESGEALCLNCLRRPARERSPYCSPLCHVLGWLARAGII